MGTDINGVDLNLLRVFLAIVEERSLTVAGHRLKLSQPAISYSLGRLRVLFDDPLFIRTKQGMQPTPTAIELAKPITQAMQSIQAALHFNESFEPSQSVRTFRISMSDMGETVFLPVLCEAIGVAAPHIRLQIDTLRADQIDDALRTGQLDFSIGNLSSLKSSTKHQLLFKESYVCITRKRSGLPRGKKISLAEFIDLSHIRINSLESSHHGIEEAFGILGVRRRIALDIGLFSVAPQILQRTDLAVTLPGRVARWFNQENEFAIYELPVDVPEGEITLHWSLDFQDDGGNQWLRGLIIELLTDFGKNI